MKTQVITLVFFRINTDTKAIQTNFPGRNGDLQELSGCGSFLESCIPIWDSHFFDTSNQCFDRHEKGVTFEEEMLHSDVLETLTINPFPHDTPFNSWTSKKSLDWTLHNFWLNIFVSIIILYFRALRVSARWSCKIWVDAGPQIFSIRNRDRHQLQLQRSQLQSLLIRAENPLPIFWPPLNKGGVSRFWRFFSDARGSERKSRIAS